MQYLHQSTYGHAGGIHLAKPQFVMKGKSIYATAFNKDSPIGKPLYNVKGGKVYATAHHPEGKSLHPVYEIHGDKVHTTDFHPNHNPSQHAFQLKPHL